MSRYLFIFLFLTCVFGVLLGGFWRAIITRECQRAFFFKICAEKRYKVGETITDGEGNEWVVAQKWEQTNGYTDYQLFNKETGEEGSLRLLTSNN